MLAVRPLPVSNHNRANDASRGAPGGDGAERVNPIGFSDEPRDALAVDDDSRDGCLISHFDGARSTPQGSTTEQASGSLRRGLDTLRCPAGQYHHDTPHEPGPQCRGRPAPAASRMREERGRARERRRAERIAGEWAHRVRGHLGAPVANGGHRDLSPRDRSGQGSASRQDEPGRSGR